MLPQKSIPAIILRIVCGAWLIGKLVSYKLWLATRLFPLAPVSDTLTNAPAWVHAGLFFAGLAAILAVMLFPAKRGLLATVISLELLSCLLDQNRWQPWEYQYLFITAIFLINAGKEHVGRLIAFVIAAAYLYAGLNKLTPGFLSSVWADLILRHYLHVPGHIIGNRWVYNAGYLLAMAETALAIGLFIKRTQKLSAYFILAMHLFIILFLGITGIRHNAVVWPWNVALAALVYLLFIRDHTQVIDRTMLLKGANNLIWLCWGLLPAFSFAGLWDNYLSSNLYSGRQPFMLICVADTNAVAELKPYLEKDGHQLCSGQAVINVNRWAFTELHVPPYPQQRVQRQLKQVFNAHYPQAGARFLSFGHALWKGKPAHNKPVEL